LTCIDIEYNSCINLWLFFMGKIPSEYRGLPIDRKDKLHWYAWINATYHIKTQSITVYDRMEKKTPKEIEVVLYHEWCHHIYMNKVTKTYKTLWRFISNWKLIPILNVLLWTNYKTNAYVSGASKRNINEDFAWTLAQWVDEWKHNNYIDMKIKLATNILNYFSNK